MILLSIEVIFTGGIAEGDYIYNDLRDMLSVGLFGFSNGSNLEAVFNCKNIFSEPIDIIISPMKDSNWDTNVDWSSWPWGAAVAN